MPGSGPNPPPKGSCFIFSPEGRPLPEAQDKPAAPSTPFRLNTSIVPAQPPPPPPRAHVLFSPRRPDLCRRLRTSQHLHQHRSVLLHELFQHSHTLRQRS